jgi:DNA processing protein
MLLHQIALTLLPNIGDIRAKNLVAYCGGVEAIFTEKRQNLLKIPGIGNIVAESISSKNGIFNRAEEEIKFIEKHKIQPLFYLSDEYPAKLKECPDSPLMLYYKGNADLNKKKILSIVGTRSATDYGKIICKQFVKALSDLDILIVSGLAYGIDICAHKEALSNDLMTVGVLGHGLDRIYPIEHKSVAQQMLEQGGLLTSFMSKTKPDKMNFPARNAIIAGIADATLVVESKIKGGALITAEIANSYSRDVFAVPGKIGDKCSEGCNYFIKANKAALVESAEDIKYFMQWYSNQKNAKPKQTVLFTELKPEEKVITDILKDNNESSIDFLCSQSQMTTGKIAEILLNLEIAGVIKSLPGKIYKLVSSL